MFLASIQFFVVLDSAVQTQHITNQLELVKVPVILMVQSLSFCVFGYFHLFRQNGSQHWWKCWWKGMKEPSLSPWTGSWQVLESTSWISSIGQPSKLGCFSTSTKFCLQFISIVLHTFDAIEIIAFFRAPFRSASISSPIGFWISHVAFKEQGFGKAVPESLYKTAVLGRHGP